MKIFELKKNSWHYRLANFGSDRVCLHSDICTYIRSVMIGAFWFAAVLAVGLFFAGCTLFAIGNLFSWLFLGYELAQVTISIGMIYFSVTLMFAYLYGREVVQYKIRDGEPGFVRLAYRSWKDKFCAKVEFE